MNHNNRFQELMERVRHLHQDFTEVWTRARTAELRKADLEPSRLPYMDDRHLRANRIAYEAARPQSERLKEALGILFAELPFESFLQGNPAAIDTMLDFVEIDIPAFRCGYEKEWCFHKLKSLPLSPNQIQRLQQLTLALCLSKGPRRELRKLARLMIKLADRQLVTELQALAESEAVTLTATHLLYTKRKARYVFQIILNGRADLN